MVGNCDHGQQATTPDKLPILPLLIALLYNASICQLNHGWQTIAGEVHVTLVDAKSPSDLQLAEWVHFNDKCQCLPLVKTLDGLDSM
eukprot:3738801-Amphidinium_carterae.1